MSPMRPVDMRYLRIIGWWLLASIGMVLAWTSGAQPSQRVAVELELQGPIGPASVDYVTRGLTKAAQRQAAAVVLRIDTPGGLDTSMREIIRAILASPVPVLSWVGPSGARAASAGTYILYASHVAAMAPGTNLGAATPVAIGGFGSPDKDRRAPDDSRRDGDAAPAADDERRSGAAGSGDGGSRQRGAERGAPDSPMAAKAVNDAVAYIRSLARLRGRDADWAESAVRDAASLDAEAALKRNVIDLVATGTGELLRQAHGREVTVREQRIALDTRDLTLEAIAPDWRNRLLGALTNPNLALILMMIGFYGLLFEFINPGAMYPGTIGAIALLVGLYSLSALPVTFAGIALMALGLALVVAEAVTPSFGILGIGGTIALVLGATILIDTDLPAFQVSWPLISGVAVAGLIFAVVAGRAALQSRGRPKETGHEGMIGLRGRVLDWSDGAGHVWTAGERWRAVSAAPLAPGDTVRVAALDGLTLTVEPDASNPH